MLSLCFAQSSLIIFARVSPGHCSIPSRVMCPRPFRGNRAVDNRPERARLLRSGFVNVDYETGKHNQRRNVVNHVTAGNPNSRNYIVEPHHQSADQKQYDAHDNRPEVKLLSTVEETGVSRLQRFPVCYVILKVAHKAAI